MSFDFYEGARTESKAPQITVRRSGQMVLTGAAVALMGEGVTHAQIGYDPKAGAVGIRPVDEAGRGRYKLRPQPNGSSLIDGRRFFSHHGLILEAARTFGAESFGDGIVGFRMGETAQEEQDSPAAEPKPARTGKRRSRAA